MKHQLGPMSALTEEQIARAMSMARAATALVGGEVSEGAASIILRRLRGELAGEEAVALIVQGAGSGSGSS